MDNIIKANEDRQLKTKMDRVRNRILLNIEMIQYVKLRQDEEEEKRLCDDEYFAQQNIINSNYGCNRSASSKLISDEARKDFHKQIPVKCMLKGK